jgi:hypothetical protein
MKSRRKSTQSLDFKLLSRIRGDRRGAVYVRRDFFDFGSREAVAQAVHRLEKKAFCAVYHGAPTTFQSGIRRSVSCRRHPKRLRRHWRDGRRWYSHSIDQCGQNDLHVADRCKRIHRARERGLIRAATERSPFGPRSLSAVKSGKTRTWKRPCSGPKSSFSLASRQADWADA